MRLFGKVDSAINRFDRAEWTTWGFDLALLAVIVRARMTTEPRIDGTPGTEPRIDGTPGTEPRIDGIVDSLGGHGLTPWWRKADQ